MALRPPRPCRVFACGHLTPCPVHPFQSRQSRWLGRGHAASRGYGWSWQQQRRRALIRDGYRCGCGALATQVDHVVAKRDGGTDALENLQSLCPDCHGRKTGREGQARR